jgi:hypothetical protein
VVHGNLLYSKARTSRDGRTSSQCDCCGKRDTLAHILQVCARGWAARINRHNNVCAQIRKMCESPNWQVQAKRNNATGNGLRKPDLIIFNKLKAYVFDASVVSDQADIVTKHNR